MITEYLFGTWMQILCNSILAVNESKLTSRQLVLSKQRVNIIAKVIFLKLLKSLTIPLC